MSERDEQLELDQTIAKVQGFWQKFQNPLLIAIAVIVIGGGGWYGYQEYVVKPKEDKAADALYRSQLYFSIDSARLVLNGDGQTKGALYVINNFSGTKAANLAKFYAGISYLHLGEFANAVKYLKDFSTDAKQIQLLAYGNLGDAYSELNKKEEAIASYKKAASTFEKDENSSAEYLFRAALLEETSGKTKEAVELYKELKDKFPKSEKGLYIDRYIYRLTTEKN